MKIILSRKGFDSANGGIVSPIMEDGTLVSFPIPSKDKDSFDDLMYCDQPYSKILEDLNYKGGHNCHVDPDLSIDRRKDKNEGGVRFSVSAILLLFILQKRWKLSPEI